MTNTRVERILDYADGVADCDNLTEEQRWHRREFGRCFLKAFDSALQTTANGDSENRINTWGIVSEETVVYMRAVSH